jgi:hypothetical protein
MNRINLDNGTWFDADAAKKWSEGTYFDGNNHISKATGSQWDHEDLYRTKGGKWVISWWSQYQGRDERIEEVTAQEAHAWLARNGKKIPKDLAEFDAAAEI